MALWNGRNDNGFESLTPREMEILTLIGTGANNADIAHHLAISKRTVETHVGSIYRKLGLKGRPHAVLFAVGCDLVDV